MIPSIQQTQVEKVSRTGMFFLSILILSFSYEIPVINLTGYYRLNPRLFDLTAFLLFIYWLFAGRRFGWRVNISRKIIKYWVIINAFFAVATLFSIAWLPMGRYYFSLFYLIKYAEILIVILLFNSAPLTKKQTHYLLKICLLGGLWVASYALLQYFGILSTQRYLPSGAEIPKLENGIYSSLGTTYFHLGMFSVLICCLGFVNYYSKINIFQKILTVFIILMSVSSALVSGSKGAAIGVAMVMSLLVLQKPFRTKIGVYVLIVIVIVVGIFVFNRSITKIRIQKGHGGTPIQRFVHGFHTLQLAYETHGPKLLLVGGGFYSVPLRDKKTGKLHYRVGYGNHNIYLFPLEQAGVGAFIASLLFWVAIYRELVAKCKDESLSNFSRLFASGMKTYLLPLICIGFAGQVFFLGFGTEHFTAYQLILFNLAVKDGIDERETVL